MLNDKPIVFENIELLEMYGWKQICEMPVTIIHTDGSIATGQAATKTYCYLHLEKIEQDKMLEFP